MEQKPKHRISGLPEAADKPWQFQPGNQLWKMRRRIVVPESKKRFPTPEHLWEEAVEYFEWVQSTPLDEQKAFALLEEGRTVKKMRAMTIEGLCAFLGIASRTFREYRDNDDYKDVCDQIENIMFEWSFSGAAAGLLNPAIVARKLKLSEKIDVESPDGSLSPPKRILLRAYRPEDDESA